MYKITELGRSFGLSRSTLLYYHRIGLLAPSGRTDAEYRVYTETDRDRLEMICAHRQAGLTLAEIRSLLDAGADPDTEMLKRRLSAIGGQIRRLQGQQRVLAGMLRSAVSGCSPAGVDKETWVAILRAAGMDDAAMERWHREFEQRAPDAHHEFLLSLGISEAEAISIRKLSLNEDAMKYFFELFESLPRQGPGSAEFTWKALKAIPDLPEKARVLDIGCGCGAQTLDLARRIDGKIVAMDNHAPFIERLKKSIETERLKAVVDARTGSMFELAFKPEAFDLIWSEGAMYILGVERGLAEWKPYLKPGGHLVFSEASWFVDHPPKEIQDYWMDEYPAMETVAGTLERIRRAGYSPVTHFPLPPKAWEEPFYGPMRQRLAELEAEYAGITGAEAVFAMSRKEIEMFEKYQDAFGYAFFIARKP